jgi:hypothetical protein
MSNLVRQWIELFDAMPEADKRSALAEIQRRSQPLGAGLADVDLDALADELFTTLDTEEARHADR